MGCSGFGRCWGPFGSFLHAEVTLLGLDAARQSRQCSGSSWMPPTTSCVVFRCFISDQKVRLRAWHCRHLDGLTAARGSIDLAALSPETRGFSILLVVARPGQGPTSVGLWLIWRDSNRDRGPLYGVHAAQTSSRHAARLWP